ncbi:MAG: RHS repeat-associated core domain-containing protein [Terriglobales bacterium]
MRPDQSQEVIAWDATTGLPTDEKFFDAGNSSPRKEVVFTNNGSFPASAVTYLDGARVGELDTSFDSYSNLTNATKIDWARDPSGATRSITTMTYCCGSSYAAQNIVSLVMDAKTTNGAGTEVAETFSRYDANSPVASGISQNHDPRYSTSFTTRGNISSTMRVLGYLGNSPRGIETDFWYDDAGNLVSYQPPWSNSQRAMTYGACNGAYPTSMPVAGGSETVSYECARGGETAATDPNNDTASFGFDAFGRTSGGTAPDGGAATVNYPSPNMIESAIKIDSSTSLNRWTVTDGYGRPIFSQTAAPSGCDTVETVYDAEGRVARTSAPYNTTCATPSGATSFTSTTFDGLSRPITIKSPEGSTTTYIYSQNAVKIMDPAGVSRVIQTDGLGNLWKVCEVSAQAGSGSCGTAIAASGFLTQYSFDAAGRMTTVQQGSQTRTFAYDWAGRLTAETNPESGTTTFQYDSASDPTCPAGASSAGGKLVLKVDATGAKTCLTWDQWGRLAAKSFSDGTFYSYTYDGSATTHSLGRLASAYSQGGGGIRWTSLQYTYDPAGRPATVMENPAGLNGGGWTTTYTYNYLGEPTLIASPSTLRTLRYTYDIKGRPTALQDNGNSFSFISGRSYNSADQLTTQQFVPSAGMLVEDVSYNSDLQPWQFDLLGYGSNDTKLQYQWGASIDGSGNVTSGDDNGTLRKLLFPNTTAWSVTYSHDDLGRVSAANSGDSLINVSENYDQYGNRNSQSGTLNESFPADPATNRVTGFGFDAAGRLTSGDWGAAGQRALQWFASGSLQSYVDPSTTVVFMYDPFGRRIEAATSGGPTEYFFYGANDGGHALAVWNTSTGWRTNFLVGGEVLGHILQNGDVEMYATDPNGSTIEYMRDGTLQTPRYYPFGEEEQASPSEYPWTNQRRDGNGLDVFWYRTYASNLARWLSPDPAGPSAADPADPQTWNAYGYLAGHPLADNDVDGRGPTHTNPYSPRGANYNNQAYYANLWEARGCSLDNAMVDCRMLQGEIEGGNAGWDLNCISSQWAAIYGGRPAGAGDGGLSCLTFTQTFAVVPVSAQALFQILQQASAQQLLLAQANAWLQLKWWQQLLSPVHDFSDPRPDCATVSAKAIGENLAADLGAGPPPGADAGAALAAAASAERNRAAGYAMTKLLVVPLRSATYRGVMATADALEVGSAGFAFAPL